MQKMLSLQQFMFTDGKPDPRGAERVLQPSGAVGLALSFHQANGKVGCQIKDYLIVDC